MNGELRPVEAWLEALEAQLGLADHAAADPTYDPGAGLPAADETLGDDDPAASCVCHIHGTTSDRERFRG